MDADEMMRHVEATFDGLRAEKHLGDAFYYYDPDGDLPLDRTLPFATVVTGDHYDTVSDLDRRGAYRLNVGLTKAAYVERFGPVPAERDEHGVLATGADQTMIDTLLPHPFYAYWMCVVNPGAATLDEALTLLADAHAFAARKHDKRTRR